jgi:hypothetical protein
MAAEPRSRNRTWLQFLHQGNEGNEEFHFDFDSFAACEQLWLLQYKESREGTRILNREIREKGGKLGILWKGFSQEILAEMIDSKILHCDER